MGKNLAVCVKAIFLSYIRLLLALDAISEKWLLPFRKREQRFAEIGEERGSPFNSVSFEFIIAILIFLFFPFSNLGR